MTRQTAFPGIWVEQIGVEKPPFDEKGVVQEFVGRGVAKDFEPLQTAASITKENIGDTLREFEELVGPLRDTYKVRYKLLVRVPKGNIFTKRGVSIRARTWARLKNPFEPDLIEVSDPVRDNKLSGENIGDIYSVTVTVTK